MQDMIPTTGMRFLHRVWLDPETKKPQLYVVTKVKDGTVHYRPVYKSNDGKEKFGLPNWVEADKFSQQVLAVETKK